jgi:hypothetical protein
MTSESTEWPSTPIPEPVQNLINRFFTLVDTKSEEARMTLSEGVFSPTGQWVHPSHVFTGAERYALLGL